MLQCGVFARRGRLFALMGVLAVAATLVVGGAGEAEARKKKPRAVYAPPYAAMVLDVKSGRVLHAENEDALRHPASITKVMTLYLLFEQVERGRMQLDTPLRVSQHAASQPPSKVGLRPGGTIAVEDAILALVTKSANDVAAVVAENISGSEEAFAREMTRKARALGMSRTVFRNASGLPDPAQVTTARDLTLLAQAVQDRFPDYYHYFERRSFTFAGRVYGNHNKLLGRVHGVDGIKTGYTRASGFNLMTNAQSGGRHIVAVVLGGRSGAQRDRIVADLVEEHLPRAFAGARRTPLVLENRATAVAAAPEVESTAAVRRPLDLNAMRPAVATAAGATSTTTPTSGAQRWSSGNAAPAPAPANPPASALAFAAAEPIPPRPVARVPAPSEERAPQTAARPAPAPAAPARPVTSGSPQIAKSPWVIQIGAVDDEKAAMSILEKAKSEAGRTLRNAAPFTEKVVSDGNTLFRAT